MEHFKVLKEYMGILGKGVSNSDYPLYCKYLYSDGDHVITNDNKSFVMIDLKLPFIGFVNYYVLSSILEKRSDEFKVKVEDDKLIITDKSFKSEIMIDMFEPPDYSKVLNNLDNIKFIRVDKDIISALIVSGQFTSKKTIDTERSVISPNGVISTTGNAAFFYEFGTSVEQAIRLNKEIVAMIDETVELGSDGINTIYKSEGIICIFSLGVQKFDPVSVTRLFYSIDTESYDIISFEQLQNAVKQLAPMAYGEKDFIVSMNISDKKVKFSYESAVNGVTTFEYDVIKSPYIPDITINVNGNFVKNLKLDNNFIVCYNELFYNKHKGFMLNNPNYTCLITGVIYE